MGSVATFLAAASSQIGKPYHYGGDNLQTGFDCSGLVFWAAQQAGAPIGARSTFQMKDVLPPTNNPGTGDVVFLDNYGHVGICLNEGCTMMLDAPSTGHLVRVESVADFGPVSSYAKIPGLTADAQSQTMGNTLAGHPVGDSGATVSGASGPGDWINTFGGLAGDVTNPLGAVESAIGGLPGDMMKVFFGDNSMGSILIRGVEIFAGMIVVTAGVVMFAMAFKGSRPSGNSGPGTYEEVAAQVRSVQRQQELDAQAQRGVERRARAAERANGEVAAQHERGVKRRAAADARARGKIAVSGKDFAPNGGS